MNDLDLAAQTRLTELAERLRLSDPLALDSQQFLEQVNTRVQEQLQPKPKSLNTDFVIRELQSLSQEQKHRLFVRSVGTVQHIGNGIATLSGMPMVHLEELVTFPNGVQGMVLNLDRKHVDVILLGPDTGIRGGDVAEATGRRLSIPVGMSFLGRVVDPLGRPLDDNRPIIPSEFRYVEQIAPGGSIAK